MRKDFKLSFEIVIKFLVIFLILSSFNLFINCKLVEEVEVPEEITKDTKEPTEGTKLEKVEEPVDLELWLSSEFLSDNEKIEHRVLDERLKEFRDKNSDINLIVETIPKEDMDSKIEKTFQIARDNLPDLSLIYDFSIVVEDKIARPIDDLISNDRKNDIFPFAIDGRTIDGKLLGLMLYADAKLLLYRKDIFEEVGLDSDSPPTNWNDLINKGEILTRDVNEDGIFDIFALGLPSENMGKLTSDFIFPNFLSLRGNLFDEKGVPIFHLEQNSNKIVDILNFTMSILNEPLISEIAGGKEIDPLYSGFINGRYAMIVTDSSVAFKLKNENPEIFEKTGFSLIPSKYSTIYTTLTGPSICLFTNDPKKKNAATTLINYLMETEFYSEWNYYNNKLPVTKSSFKTSLLEKEILYQIFEKLCENGKPIPEGYGIYEALYSELEKNINLAISGNIAPEDAIIQAGEIISKMVEE